MQMWVYVGLFLLSAAFEAAYQGWIRSTVSGRPLATTAWAVAVAGLGLAGVAGSLRLPGGWAVYLAGVAVGSYAMARYPRAV